MSTRTGRFDDDFIMSAWPKGCDRKRVYYHRRRRGGGGPRLAAKTSGGGGATTLVGAHPVHAAPAETRDRHIVASVLACFAKGADLLNRHVHRSRACARRDRDRTRRCLSRAAVTRGTYLR
ncbi:hypothetical protein QTP88_025406 [Uroleucon formosanum]